MQNKIRFLCLFIVLVMLVSCFAACKDTSDEPEETEGTQASTDGNGTGNGTTPGTTPGTNNGTTPGTTPGSETDYVTDELPEISHGGEPFYVLVWLESPFYEFQQEDLDPSDIVQSALHNRLLTVSERLDMDIQYIYCPGDSNGIDQFVKRVQEDVEGDQVFHAVASYSQAGGTCAAQGYFANLKAPEYSNIDLSKPWWPSNLINEATVKDKLYFVSGDISNNALNQMYLCLVNTDLLEEYRLENPQQYVKSGEWTYEKFIQYCTGVYEDRDGTPGKSYIEEGGISDIYGYMSIAQHMDCFLYNAGATIVTKDDDGNLIANENFASEKVQQTLVMLNNLLHNTDYAYCIPGSSSYIQRNIFRDGNLLFTTDRARITHEYLIYNEDLNYSVLPCPKLEEDSDYVTVMGNLFSIYSLPAYAKARGNADIGSAYIEALASVSYRTVSPALFETSFKLKYSDSALTAEIYDLIKSKISYDLGRLFADSLIGQKHFRQAITNNAASSWSYTTKIALDTLKKKLPDLQAALEGAGN